MLVATAVLAGTAGATSGGSIDASFGSGGKVVVDYGAQAFFQGLAIQPDGKILAAGGVSDTAGRPSTGLLARFNIDGSPDTSFDGDGRVMVPFVAYRGAVGLQRDGTILFAGGISNGSAGTDMSLSRFNTDGSLDTTFGNGGRVETDIDNRFDVAYEVVQEPDGKIVVVGQTIAGSNSDIVVARYTQDGRIDPTFAGDGTLTSDWGKFDVPQGVAVTPSGAIVVGGYSEDPNGMNGVVVLARYTADGRPDPTFAGDGILVTGNAAENYAGGVALQSDGRMVLAAGAKFTIERYTQDGHLDPTFGDHGRSTGAVAGYAVARAVAVQPNGKIVVSGWTTGAQGYVFVAARLLPRGTIDPAFASSAEAAPDIAGSGLPTAVALEPDSRIVAAGFSWTASTEHGALVRYLPGSCSIPAVAGKKLATARTRIAAGNCRVGTIGTAASKRVAKGLVISQTPTAGREAADWALVNLVVSRGPK